MKKPAMFTGAFLGLLFVGLVAGVLSQPDVLHVERSILIKAAPSTVYPFVSDYKSWAHWGPWRAKDPQQTVAYSEPSSGLNAWTTWDGNDEVGQGKMTFTEVSPNALLVQRLDFYKPFENVATARFSFTETGGQTEVVWSMDSEQNLTAKLFDFFVDMDAMLGPDFKQGLRSLKTLAEAEERRTAP